MSQPAGEFAPKSTYFEEREQRLAAEIARAKDELDGVRIRFTKLSEDLVKRRDEILAQTAVLRDMRQVVAAGAAEARQLSAALIDLAAACEVLSADAAELLRPPLEQVASLDAEIATLEAQEKKLSAKPSKALEQLVDRLSRLRLRRTIAEKQLKQENGEGS